MFSEKKLFLIVDSNSLSSSGASKVQGSEFEWILKGSSFFKNTYQWINKNRYCAVVVLEAGCSLKNALDHLSNSFEKLMNNNAELVAFIQACDSNLEDFHLKGFDGHNVIFCQDEFFRQFSIHGMFENINNEILSLEEIKSFYNNWRKMKSKEKTKRRILVNIPALLISIIGFLKIAIISILSALLLMLMFNFFNNIIEGNEEVVNYWESKDQRLMLLNRVIASQMREIDDLKKALLKNKEALDLFCVYSKNLNEEDRSLLKSVNPVDIVGIYKESLRLEKSIENEDYDERKDNIAESIANIVNIVRGNGK